MASIKLASGWIFFMETQNEKYYSGGEKFACKM